MKTLKTVFAIGIFSMVQAASGASSPINFHTDKETLNKVDTFISQTVESGFAGSVLISHQQNILLSKGYGFANRKDKIANGAETVFDTGSNTKQFTATAIVYLQQEGKLNFDDPISKYFKQIPEDKKAITIHQLLSHTSGLQEGFGRDFELIDFDDYLKKAMSSTLKSEPGLKYSYSNAGYSLLTRIIELVTEQDYEAFMAKTFFGPLGMKSTGYLLPEWTKQPIASGYWQGIANRGTMVEKYQRDGKISWHLKGNGGLQSTNDDLYIWLNALASGKVINKKSFKTLSSPHTELIYNRFHYAYGWGLVFKDGNIKRLSHNGSNSIFFHTIMWYPDNELIILVSHNAGNQKTEALASGIEDILLTNQSPEPIAKTEYIKVFHYIKNNSYKKASTLRKLILKDYKEKFFRPEILNRFGYELLDSNDNHWALELFKINVEIFPDDGVLWDSLGDGYLAIKESEKAKENFKKAISLGYKDSQEKLNKLKAK